jgi:hypothetical protein
METVEDLRIKTGDSGNGSNRLVLEPLERILYARIPWALKALAQPAT